MDNAQDMSAWAEKLRLAEQRLDDITKATLARESTATDLAVKQAVREASVDYQLAESRMRLDKINGSIDKFLLALDQQDKRMEKVENALDRSSAVAAAIAERSNKGRTLLIGIASVSVPACVTLLITVING